MRVLIIEDESPAAEKLGEFVKQYDEKIKVAANLKSVKETLAWFRQNPQPELVFADIELLDGNIFQILENNLITCPIIFTTAYDQFLLQAFEKNGIAYLLKPFSFEKFAAAMQKFESLKQSFSSAQENFWQEIQTNLRRPKYKERFVIKVKDGIQLLETKQITFIQMQNEIPFAFNASGEKFPLNESLTNLEKSLNPKIFFRLNRSEIVNLNFIKTLKPDFHDRLIVYLRDSKTKLVSSTNRTPLLRKWLESQ
jgi:two-component system, LytTR family, response regulator LytT